MNFSLFKHNKRMYRPEKKIMTLGQIEAEINELKTKMKAIEHVLRDYAADDQRLASLMKSRGLM